MKIIISGIIVLLFMSGCAHKISIVPSLNELREIKVENKVEANAGYYISAETKKIEVTTPGGGGDKVKYTPYADTEGALNTMLSKIFHKVYSLNSLEDKEYIDAKKIMYIFTPKIKTDSSSKNILFWPPNDFTVELTCTAIGVDGTKIWEETVQGEGHTRTKEMLHDFSLSAKRATEDAFKKMLIKMDKKNEFDAQGGI